MPARRPGIVVLSPEVAQKIAAGEVVTRPADAVKELVENAIDACLAAERGEAGHRIDVELHGGGLALIRVVDTGCGIPPGEIPLAFERHATSKLASAEDLFAIATLGFRGEALPSIAAISQVAFYSRPADSELGALVVLEAGRLVEASARAGPVGTSVTVRNLFQNVPARLRFLRTATGEAGQVTNLVGQYALAYPEIRFSVVTDGRLVLQSPGTGRLRDALLKVYDAAVVEKLLPIEAVAGKVRIRGYVSEPGTTRATRAAISIFVNRRWIQSRALSYAIEEAYQPALPAGRHPIAVVQLDIPPADVDVNVHPTKAEVRFADERTLYGALRRAVREVVMASAPLPIVGVPLAPFGMPSDSQGAGGGSGPPPEPTQGSLGLSAEARRASPPESADPPGAARQADPRAVGLPILHPLGQVQRTYIVAEGPDGVYFVDQHTAHERIRYEEIQSSRASVGIATQSLLEPLVVELTPRQWDLLDEGAPRLREIGFAVEPFGERACLLRAIPAILARSGRPSGAAGEDDLTATFREVVDALALEGPAEGIDRLAATVACHSAVRSGDSLTAEEIRELLGRLEGLDVWRYCPHGRPIVIRLDSSQLAKDFKRI
jgi:DNA mismatch repair protein MutL